MQYLGSKNKLAKDIIPIIQSFITEKTQYYIEPFVGGANVIDKIQFEKKLGSDVQPYLVALLQYIQDLNNEIPTEITEEEYHKVKDNKDDYPDWYVGLVGFSASFGAKWFGGYAKAAVSDGAKPRNRPSEAIRNLEKQRKNLQDTKFVCTSYENITNFEESVIYCDIPYRDTTGYGTSEFDYEKFYQWCIDLSSKGNTVLISEYNMPEEHFEVIWQKEHTTTVSKTNKHAIRIEKIFKVR